MTTSTGEAPNPHLPVRPDWLARRPEAALEPELPIIDAHHHLWEKPENPYLLPELLQDIAGGHAIRATIYEECKSRYHVGGDALMRPLGEVEFAAAVGAEADRMPGVSTRVCAGIVGFADLRAGAAASPVLQAHVAAGGGRFRGVRHTSAWHPDPAAKGSSTMPEPGLLLEPGFREGFAHLAPLGLTFDAWMFHTQLAELRDLADAFPGTTIILNHVGGPLGIGPYASRHRHVFAEWSAAMRSLATFPNLHVKLGGFGMRLFGFRVHEQELPPSSEMLAAAWGPYIETCVAAFGAERCMFESNFPVDKGSCGYTELWNAFKRVTAGWAPAERANLFFGTAARVYGLSIPDAA